MNAEPSPWMKVNEAAEILRVDRKTIRRWLKAGKLPVRTTHLEMVLRLHREDFETYLERNSYGRAKSA